MVRIQIVQGEAQRVFSGEWKLILGIMLTLAGILVVFYPLLLVLTTGALLTAVGIGLILDAWPSLRPPRSLHHIRSADDSLRGIYIPREQAERMFSRRF